MKEYGLRPRFKKNGMHRCDPRKTLYMSNTGYEPKSYGDTLVIDGDRTIIITFDTRRQLLDYQDFENSLNEIEFQGAMWNINNSSHYRCFKMKNLARCKERMLEDIDMFSSIYDVDGGVIYETNARFVRG